MFVFAYYYFIIQTIMMKMVYQHLQVKSQTSSYLGRPPTQKETFSTEHLKPLYFYILSETKHTSFRLLSQLMFTNYTIAKTRE